MPSLKDLVAREIERRKEGEGVFVPFCFVATDEAGAMTDVGAAAKAVAAFKEAGNVARGLLSTAASPTL